MFHWIGIGILIAIGFALAPYVVALIAIAIPGIIGGAVGFFLSAGLIGSPPAVVVCTLIGIFLPYWLINRSNG